MSNISFKLGGPMPKSIGATADAYHDIREVRLAMDKDVKLIKDREKELLDHIIDNLSASDDTGASGKKYRAQIVTSEQPTVTDWPLLYDYIHEHDRFDLLGKSLGTKAAKEMHAADKAIPGVGKITVKKVSITKI